MMAEPPKNVTSLTIPVPELRRTITAVIEPALEPGQQEIIDEEVRKKQALADVVRVLIVHSAQLGRSVRSLAIEDAG